MDSSWYCDQCIRRFKHGEIRFNCTVCDNYDLCADCLNTLQPSHPHRLVPELAYRLESKVTNYAGANMASNLHTAGTLYRDRYCLGTRDVDPTNPSLYADSYSWLTFETVIARVKNFGNGLRSLVEPRGYLAICAKNRPEWIVADFACVYQNIVSVPIYCLFNDRELIYIINNTKVSVLVCDREMMLRFSQLASQCPVLRHIICMDAIPHNESGMRSNDVSIHYMGDIEMRGANKQYDPVNIDPNECLTIFYTSGSTGFPKGAMVSEHTYRTSLSRHCRPVFDEYISFCYEPLAWVSGRDWAMRVFLRGGRTGFSTSDTSRMMEDLALVRPTGFSGTPAIWNKIYAEFMTTLSLTAAGLSAEARLVEEDRLLKQFSNLIPSRCKSLGVGGAKVSPAVLDFMKGCFSRCSIYESYGTTECGNVAYNTVMDDKVQFRLTSVPEMGYTTEDLPYPRGELYVKGKEMFSGYFNNPEETQAALTEDGFFRTGDIVELRILSTGKRQVNVIDRKKNFFKLSQGQFISPELLENIYIQSSFVRQIYIHGDLLADSVAAVVVPNRELAQAFAVQHNLANFDEHKPDPLFHEAVLQSLREIAEKESLNKHEVPSRLVIDFQPFTAENGLLTSTLKLCRHKLAAHYSARIKRSASVQQRLKDIIETTTGQSSVAHGSDSGFLPTGGDSLTTVRLSRRIEQDLGISIPVGILMKPDMTVEQLATIIEDPSKISSLAESIVPQLLNDSRLDLPIIVRARKATATSPSKIFVTGATGFVGAFLLAELLEVYRSRCEFICLVRCDSPTNALNRIERTMRFHQIWKEEFRARIIPLPGDLGKPRFGLNDDMYQSLADQIDLIFHCGAVVIFLLPYSALYDSNVQGTREIIRLATHNSTCVPVHYISTISVLSAGIREEVSIDQVRPDGLTNGYAQSKWVAEKLMTQASQLGLPVVIYRLGSIGASVRTGACNQNDLHTLLLATMMNIGCYPKSILSARLYALPVDFTARCIRYLSGLEPSVNGKVYHILDASNAVLFSDILRCMSQESMSLTMVSSEEWRSKLRTMNDRKALLEAASELLANISFDEGHGATGGEYRSSIPTMDLPVFDDLYLSRWLTFIRDFIVSV